MLAAGPELNQLRQVAACRSRSSLWRDISQSPYLSIQKPNCAHVSRKLPAPGPQAPCDDCRLWAMQGARSCLACGAGFFSLAGACKSHVHRAVAVPVRVAGCWLLGSEAAGLVGEDGEKRKWLELYFRWSLVGYPRPKGCCVVTLWTQSLPKV